MEHARGITCSPFPLFPKPLSQEVCLAQSCSLQGGLGASKQRAEALTPACAIPVGLPLLSPVGVKRKRSRPLMADSFHMWRNQGRWSTTLRTTLVTQHSGAFVRLCAAVAAEKSQVVCGGSHVGGRGRTLAVQTFPALFAWAGRGFGAANRTASMSFSDMQIESIILVTALLRCGWDPVGECRRI